MTKTISDKTSAQSTRTYRDHVRKVSSLKKEVEELHPILQRLFPCLPTITKVEYHQGPSEMGADFVLQRTDPALEQINYVGIIAKIGAIKQDHQEVNRQIEECEIERKFDGGSKIMTINEIWVVATGKITENAKTKIHKKYSARAIKFIAQEELARLLDTHIPDIWDDLPPGISAYFARLREELQIADSQSNIAGLPQERFYIELDIHEIDTESYGNRRKVRARPRKQKNVDIQNVIESRPSVIVIEGDMGHGKSKLIRELAYRYVDPVVYQENRIVPIITTAKKVVENYDGDIAMFSNDKLKPLLEYEPSESAHGLIFVDGIDEILDTEDGETAISILLDGAKDVKNATVVLTTRPSSANSKVLVASKTTDRYGIAPLSFAKLAAFIQQVCMSANVSQRLIEDVQKSHLFRQLPQSPIAAILLSRLITETSSDLPSSMTELYSQSLELMLGRWDMEKGLETQKEYEASTAICSSIAKYMMDNGLNEIAYAEAFGFAEGYLGSRKHLEIDASQIFETIVSRSGVLVLDPLKSTVTFRHRSFAEFLFAKHCMEDGNISVDKTFFEAYWASSRFFYVGLKKDCPELLEEIISWPASSANERWAKIFSIPQYLLAAITTPYKVTENNLAGMFLESAQLYLDLVRNPVKYNFGRMTEIEFFHLFQHVVRNSFSYKFFASALDQATVEIADSVVNDETKAYALFFASVVGLDLKTTAPADFMLKQFKPDELPIPVSLGLRCETDAYKADRRSPLMRRHQRTTKKTFSQANIGRELERLIEVPLVPSKKKITGKR